MCVAKWLAELARSVGMTRSMIAIDQVSLETNSAQDSTIRPAAHRGVTLPAAHACSFAPRCDLQIRRYSTGGTEYTKHRHEGKQEVQDPFLAMLGLGHSAIASSSAPPQLAVSKPPPSLAPQLASRVNLSHGHFRVMDCATLRQERSHRIHGRTAVSDSLGGDWALKEEMTAHRADRAGDSRSHGAGCRQEPAAPPAHGGSPPVPEPSARQSTTRRGSLWRWALVLLVAVAGPRRAMCQVPDKGYPCGNHTAGREGSLLQFSGNSTTRQAGHLLMHTGGDSAFYASTFTVQLFAKFTTNKIDQAAAAAAKTTLIGNFNGNSGWRVECWSKKCCLVAILRQINGQQQVCTDNTRGEEITSGRWFQLTARYDSGGPPYDAINGRRGRAAIFVNGIKHNEVEWGNVGRGALRFQNAPFAIGGAFGDGPSSFFTGMIDEVRLWNSALTDAEVLDTAFEIGWQWPDASGACASTSSPATPYSTNYSRIASVTNLTTLVLYVKDPSADTVANQNIRGQPWINASAASDIVWSSTTERYIDQEPLLEVLPTSQGVLSDVFPRLTAAHYKSGQRDDVTVVVSQSGVTVLDLRVRDPNYDDVVSIRAMLDFLDPRMAVGCAREGIGTANMKRCGHPGENLPDVVGWHSFAGLAGYEGLHGEGSTVGNDVVVGQMLDADNVLGYSDQDSANVQLRRVQMKTQCRGEVNPASNAEGSSGDGLPGFLPPYSDVASRLHVRLVWAHRPDHDWWVPEEGFEYLLKVRSYSRYRKTDNEQAGTAQCPQPTLSGQSQKRGLCTTLKLGMHVQFSPEFVNGQSYPKKQQEQPHGPPYAYMEYGGDTVSDNAVRHDDAVAVAVGETLHFTVRAQDRNKGDLIEIRAREDPGLPPGHDDTSSLPTSSPPIKVHGLQTYPARSQVIFTAQANRVRYSLPLRCASIHRVCEKSHPELPRYLRLSSVECSRGPLHAVTSQSLNACHRMQPAQSSADTIWACAAVVSCLAKRVEDDERVRLLGALWCKVHELRKQLQQQHLAGRQFPTGSQPTRLCRSLLHLQTAGGTRRGGLQSVLLC